MQYPQWWERLVAAVIDGIIMTIVVLVISTIFVALGGSSVTAIRILGFLAALINTALVVGYKAFFEAGSWQATPGKMAMGLKVVDESGQRFGVVSDIVKPVSSAPWAPVRADVLSDEQVRPWLLPAMYLGAWLPYATTLAVRWGTAPDLAARGQLLEHQIDQLAVWARQFCAAHQQPFAQHKDLAAKLLDFGQLVRNQDEGLALFLSQMEHGGEEQLFLFCADSSGGLVQDQQLRPA